MLRRRAGGLAFVGIVLGCAEVRGTDPFATGAGWATGDPVDATGDAIEPDESGSSSAADDAGAQDEGDDGTKFDLASDDTGGPPSCVDGGCGCNAVDILFVIDSSVSMGSYQAGLSAAAPAFTDAIFAALPSGVDLHVGLTTTSFYTGGAGSPGETNCQSNGTIDEFMQYYDTPDEVDNGENGGQGRLRVHEGQPFFATDTASDPAPLKSWLTGNIVGVGETGSVFEMPAAGAAWAFHPANAVANQGFVRDAGAVLVIFALTDEVGNSPESVDAYHDMVVSAKQACGGDDCIVTGGIMKPCMTMVGGNAEYEFLASFGETPVVGDIGPELDDCYEDCASGDIAVCPVNGLSCAQSDTWTAGYADALGGTLAQIIADTCASIPPVG